MHNGPAEKIQIRRSKKGVRTHSMSKYPNVLCITIIDNICYNSYNRLMPITHISTNKCIVKLHMYKHQVLKFRFKVFNI